MLLNYIRKNIFENIPWEITNPTALQDHSRQRCTDEDAEETGLKKDFDLKDAATKAEYEAIMKVLKEVNFNKTRAAEILRIDRKTLYNKIKSYEESNN